MTVTSSRLRGRGLRVFLLGCLGPAFMLTWRNQAIPAAQAALGPQLKKHAFRGCSRHGTSLVKLLASIHQVLQPPHTYEGTLYWPLCPDHRVGACTMSSFLTFASQRPEQCHVCTMDVLLCCLNTHVPDAPLQNTARTAALHCVVGFHLCHSTAFPRAVDARATGSSAQASKRQSCCRQVTLDNTFNSGHGLARAGMQWG